MNMATESTVEANSLSLITAIAADPPLHPSAPLPTTLRNPLTLYIARVPGSRDVFLTPLKPKEKVVSAEDVQSSLYFVHFSSPNDLESISSRPTSANSDAAQLVDPSTSHPVRRRPILPQRKALPVSPIDSPHVSPGQSAYQPQRIARKPVSHDVENTRAPPVPPHLELPDIPPRLRAFPTPLEDDGDQSVARLDEQFDEDVGDLKALVFLTVIRRDPGSGEQWNVATIRDPPIHEVSSSTLQSPSAGTVKRSGAPLYLEVTNPAYVRFAASASDPHSESRVSTSSRSSSNSETHPFATSGPFQRRLYMPGSRYAEHGYGHRKLASADMTPTNSEPPRPRHERTLSDLTAHRLLVSSVDHRSKGYTFTSPWDTKCEFYTSTTGRNLKCRHSISTSASPVELSELRFNLPSLTNNNNNSNHPSSPTSAAEKRTSYFPRHFHLRTPSSIPTENDLSENDNLPPSISSAHRILDDQGRRDLTLGQEKAGGGLGGKKAKLGKLIIEPEGLKMLDLLVAANVALWWRAWEKVS